VGGEHYLSRECPIERAVPSKLDSVHDSHTWQMKTFAQSGPRTPESESRLLDKIKVAGTI
jgi:hypothetical protein